MNTKKIIIAAMICIMLVPSVSAIGGGPTDHFDNPVPYCGETNITITDKGVQTCIVVYVDQECFVNLSFQWLNYSDWTWYEYANYTGVNNTGQYCGWHNNATCYTEGDWETQYQFWRVVADFNCSGSLYQEIFYCWFTPELCNLFYIHPPNNSTNASCPPCVSLCVGVNNPAGNNMNLTFYSNLSGSWDWFYIGTENWTYQNVPNGTYCFYVPFFSQYNHTYYWYVNVTDTVTGDYDNSNIYHFRTAENLSDCPCGEEAIINLIKENSPQKDYIIGIVGTIGIIGLIGYFARRNRE